jgi:hypothetical protein
MQRKVFLRVVVGSRRLQVRLDVYLGEESSLVLGKEERSTRDAIGIMTVIGERERERDVDRKM